jgi:hypothetical protein
LHSWLTKRLNFVVTARDKKTTKRRAPCVGCVIHESA